MKKKAQLPSQLPPPPQPPQPLPSPLPLPLMRRDCRSTRVYALYQVRDEWVPTQSNFVSGVHPVVRRGTKTGFWMKSAYTPSGQYIGSPKDALKLCVKRGIIPEVRYPKRLATNPFIACSFGWSPLKRKWYGWSHRAIYGFRIGSKCRMVDCHYAPKNRGGRGEWTAKTLLDARQMAIDFAEGVS